ncbi:elongation factor G [Lacticaseibacillus yichunensis]|uniref:GTP-binding protein n=2 Tax=Bacilli TaxID=91061 RepID=A0ABW4CR16_9LACO|nr:TetM/TetW/TetO/TetS family tetracycline resistance ribosomal protection protein [Lacticaseibacillus yichunensis]
MKQITAGIVAHVDAGKTTLSEALLYRAGALRQLGRVDNGDAFLDTEALEKKRGITIFSHQASLQYDDLDLTLLDTPGHVDFASATEQVLPVLDVAILVVSGPAGVQGYTRTLWRLLARYQVPVFIFVNKMDTVGADRDSVLAQLKTQLDDGVIAFDADHPLADAALEDVATTDEEAMETYLETGTLPEDTVRALIARRKVFPVYFGAALKLTGVDDLMAGFAKWTREATTTPEFGAKVFKISHDDKNERLTWLRVTGGQLRPKDLVLGDQKINQLRIYDGPKYTVAPVVEAGQVCAAVGLVDTFAGQGLGVAANAQAPLLQPVLTYKLDPMQEDLHACLAALQTLADEDPQLHVTWSSHLQELRVQIMGAVQLEILQQILRDRFGLTIGFDAGSILYKETVTQAIEGVGHFEPLRHYAEVHLLLRPAPRGSGLQFDADVSLEVLGKNFQQLVLASLRAKEQLGVLVGAPLTDMRVTLVTGRSHLEHTVGGDFKEATWRALRQGLMTLREKGACQLLEPWYRFSLEVAQSQLGRAMTDIQRMSGRFEPPVDVGAEMSLLTGVAPVSEMQNYAQEVSAYTHGKGQLEVLVDGYRPCHNAEAVIAAREYDPVGDLENTPGSVFCAHGAGYPVHWDDVPRTQHLANVYDDAALAAMTQGESDDK